MDLIHIFKAMEMQNLDLLSYLESLNNTIAETTDAIIAAQTKSDEEINKTSNEINDLEVKTDFIYFQ